jgi:tRNA-2-methylthio-N6-dimethylallyladenosine synthase
MRPLVQLRRRGQEPGATAKGSEVGVPAAGNRLAYVETYGCQMNVADTDLMLGLLGGAGYARTDDPARADVILINTCAVREKAEERVYARASALAGYKRRAPHVVLGITGCMAEHLKDRLAERAPQVDLVVGPDGYRRLVDHLARAASGEQILDTTLDRHETYEGLQPEVAGGVIGRVTIQRGCDKFCTFCVVPYTRGRERGLAPREILRQARAAVEAGAREIQLLGQTVNSYVYRDAHGNEPDEVGFADLLRAVAATPGIERVRFTSPYPLDFSPAVIAAMVETPKVCRHVHLPLQSASDAVLARMRRGYDFTGFRALAAALRAAMPGIALTTDVLVGFCDESEEEHVETLDALEQLRFDNAFLFAYSEREGTHAARKMPDTVPAAVKQRRLAEAIAVQRRITAEILAGQVGRRERVLIEGPSRRSPHELLGRTDTFRPVIVPAAPDVFPGAVVEVTIDRATPATLFGQVQR